MRYSRKNLLNFFHRIWKLIGNLKCRSEECRAWWDVLGILLPLIGTYLLVIVGVPDLIESILTTETGDIITDQKGHPIIAETDPHTVALVTRYYWYASIAMALMTIGAIVQMRRPWTIIRSKNQKHDRKG